MIKDSYLENSKKKYILRSGELLGKVWNEAYLEFAHQQFNIKNCDKIIATLKETFHLSLPQESSGADAVNEEDEKEDDTINMSSILSECGKRSWRRKRNTRIKIEPMDREEVERAFKNLQKLKYYPGNWASNLENLFEMIPDLFLTYKEIQTEILKKSLRSTFHDSDYFKFLNTFLQVFNLSEKEGEIITFFYLIKVDEKLDDFFGSRNINILSLERSTKYFCHLFDINSEELRKFLSKESLLVKAGIVEKRREDLELSESVRNYLGGYSTESLDRKYLKKEDLSDALNLSDHHVAQNKISIFKNLLTMEKGCNILLYGHPGTGKTEFAKSLARETGMDIFFINQSDEDGEENLRFRMQAIIAAQNIIGVSNSVIVVDECDTILNLSEGFFKLETENSQDRKAWINALIENTKHKIIWISNRTKGIDDSTKRRFSYSMEFQPLSYLQRKKVWETQVSKQGISFLVNDDIEMLAREIKVNSGGITLALQDVVHMKDLDSNDAKINTLVSILKQHKSFTENEEMGLVKKTSKYSLDIINSNFPIHEILEASEEFFRNREKFIRAGIYNMNILLQGPPGTGKTEFVKHLAEVTDRELILKRVSDIKSKWYGESVKNIAASFKEAQERGSILFFDEADSFFRSREDSRDFHAEETNEFLTQMENFQGVLICATNFVERLDQASMRRFNHKVKFDYLNSNGKRQLFQSYFDEIWSSIPDEEVLQRLDQIPGLTPGDYKVVYQKNAFTKRDPLDFVIELENEVSYKKAFTKKVGLS